VSAENLKEILLTNIKEMQKLDKDALLEHRYQKFRQYGEWAEV